MNNEFDNEKILEDRIIELRDAYWSGEMKVSDAEYDKLIEKLREINPFNPLLTKIESGKISGKTVEHKVPMLSLQKVYTKDDLYEWMKKNARNKDELFLIQPKYDGISCHADHGVYSTRGDGKVGQDITSILIGLNASIDFEKDADIVNKPDFYGEIVIKNSDFNTVYKNIKNNAGNPFKNQRNAVAGILGNDEADFYAKQGAKVTLVDYDKYSFPCALKDFDLKWDIISQIIKNLDYPMDGIVVKLADKNYSKYLGFTEHHPKGQIAFKFENVSKWTVLKNIIWGMGKEQITATAVFEPVEINGTVITKAVVPMASDSLPNIVDGDFTPGTELLVERAGDVIPHIIQVKTNKNGNPFGLKKCPWCGEELVFEKTSVSCKNPSCTERSIKNIYYSLVSLGSKNIGESIVREIFNLWKVSGSFSYSPVMVKGFIEYYLNGGWENLEKIDGYGRTSVSNIMKEILWIKKNNPVSVLASLNIPNFGKRIATILIDKFQTIDNIFSSNTKYEDIVNLPNIGEVMSERIFKYISDSSYCSLVKEYVSWFEFETIQKNVSQSSKGKVCFTGAMVYERKQMFDIARKAGFEPIDSVTKDCAILVMADINSLSTKAQKARKMGIKIMTDKEFINECQK